MLIRRIQGCTRTLGQSQGYRGLPIRDEQRLQIQTGRKENFMLSSWEPTPRETELLMKGAPVILSVMGRQHPPVLIEVGNAEKDDTVPSVEACLEMARYWTRLAEIVAEKEAKENVSQGPKDQSLSKKTPEAP